MRANWPSITDYVVIESEVEESRCDALGSALRGPSTALRLARDDGLERPAKILEAIQTFFDHIKTGGVTETNRTIVAKGSARHDRDIGFTQQTIGEILRRESKLADVY